MLQQALAYIDAGFSVVPGHSVKDDHCSCGSKNCTAPGKHPRLRWQPYTKTKLTKDQIQQYWKRWPESNVIIITGRISGLAVLDVDGEAGVQSMIAAGMNLKGLPKTPTVKTGGGGYHFYFTFPEDVDVQTKAGILSKVDIRAEGGVVVAPPSLHRSGRNYGWIKGRSLDETALANFDWAALLAVAGTKQPSANAGLDVEGSDTWYESFLRGVGEGERNVAATRLAGRYLGMGMSQEEVMLILTHWNSANDPPMPHKELETTISSITQREHEIEMAPKAELLTRVSDILRMPVTGIRRITGDSPQIIIEIAGASCQITTGILLSPQLFQKAVAEATKRVVRKLSSKTSPTHDKLAELILMASEDVDAGIEATGAGEITTLLKEYLVTTPAPISGNGMVPDHGNFSKEGRIWFSLTDVTQRMGIKYGIRLSIRDTAQRFRALDAVHQEFKTESGDRLVWGVKPESMGLELEID